MRDLHPKSTLAAGLLLVAVAAAAEDWPTHRHDNRRSGVTAEGLRSVNLKIKWIWRSPSMPQPAWAGPAKWDAYARIPKLGAMRDYDRAFGMAVAAGKVYFGSSADDSVHCLEAGTGKEKWVYTTDGPVRISPTVVGGKVYFGSDDGHAYCVTADSGRLVWKYSPKPDVTRILQNGKLISPYPCRTGVLVEGNTAYFAAGMLPWKPAYVCAVDSTTGKVGGSGRYVSEHRLTPEGAVLAAAGRLVFPQGRVAPVAVDRASGKAVGRVGKGQGGTFALVTKDSHVFYGQGCKDSGISSQSQGVAFAKGRRLVVAGDMAFVSTETEVSALARSSKKQKWKRPCRCSDSMILAGGALFVGGRDVVMAFEAQTGTPVWQAGVDGRAYDLAAADGCLYASTSEGAIYCFAGTGGKASAKPLAQARAKPTNENHLAVGPFVEFTGPTTATVRWDGGRSGSSRLVLSGGGSRSKSVRAVRKGGLYEAKLTALRPDTVYSYTFQGARPTTFELDTFFNYGPQPVGEAGKAYSARGPGAVSSAKAAVASAATDRGICVVLPSGDGRLAYEIARCSRFRVIGADTDVRKVNSARRALISAGVYGSRVVIYHVRSLDKLPFVGEFANLLVSKGRRSRETARLVIPGHGVVLTGAGLGGRTAWARKTRPPLKETGVWTHQYGRADNSAYGGESLAGARSTADFHVQWLGRPGPRYQPDRNGRKPAPLAAAGRLFGQGLERIVAIDAFNGTILWSLEIPPLGRFNIPRDCGNWCADDDHVYAVVRDRCWVIDAGNGSVTRTCKVIPGPRRTWRYDWGYVADGGDVIVGSAVKQGSAFMEYWGGAGQGWYDAVKGAVTHKVCSNALFALDKTRGSKRWYHTGGAIINSTITIGGGTVYFVECSNRKVLGLDTGRMGAPELWQDQHLVALDVDTGKTKWRRPIDTADGVVMFSMAHGGGKLVVVSSTSDKKYEVTAFDADGGSKVWTKSTGWPGGKGDHGKAMSRPAIVDDKVFVRPAVFDLSTGSALGMKMPGGGCGTYAFSKHSAFYRSRTVNMWSFDGGKKSSWTRLRPGCWLSTVPALGMILSPEAGGGCKCANWIETSIAFMPNRVSGKE